MYQFLGSQNNVDANTTYSTLTQALVDTGTETTGKLITAKIVKDTASAVELSADAMATAALSAANIYTDAKAEAVAADIPNTRYGTCATSAATTAKVGTVTGFALSTGARVALAFTYANTAASPTLNVSSTGAKTIRHNNAAITAASGALSAANYVYEFVYDGTYWQLINPIAAPLASPAFTGTPTAPTAAAGVSTTQLATTAFVMAAVNVIKSQFPTSYMAINVVVAPGNSFSTVKTLSSITNSNLGVPTISAVSPSTGTIAINTTYSISFTIAGSFDVAPTVVCTLNYCSMTGAPSITRNSATQCTIAMTVKTWDL